MSPQRIGREGKTVYPDFEFTDCEYNSLAIVAQDVSELDEAGRENASSAQMDTLPRLSLLAPPAYARLGSQMSD